MQHTHGLSCGPGFPVPAEPQAPGMARWAPLIWPWSIFALCLAVSGCGSDSSDGNKRNPADGPRLADAPGVFDLLQDPPTDKSPLALAARAMVKIERASGIMGSGFFLDDGQTLITNAHVLGPDACFLEGCTVRLHIRHFRGSSAAQSRWVTLVPYAYKSSIDLAAFRTAAPSPDQQPYVSEFKLTAGEDTALPAAGEAVTLAGHASAQLLKLSPGRMAIPGTPFLSSELLTLPGTSGGPLLDRAGRVIGLHHRGTQNLDYLRNNGYFGVSLSTRANVLKSALAAEQRSQGLVPFKSLKDVTTEDDLRRYAEAALTSPQAPPAIANLGAGSRAEALWKICMAPPPTDGTDDSQDDDRSTLCPLAAAALDCSTKGLADAAEQGAPLECPAPDQRSVWGERFAKLDSGTSDTGFWSVRAPLLVIPDGERRLEATARIKDWLGTGRDNDLLSVDQAAIAMDVLHTSVVGGTDYRGHFESFRTIPRYYFQYQGFLRGLYVLARDGVLPVDKVRAAMADTRRDPEATLGDVLVADELSWRLGALGNGTLAGARSDSPYGLP